MRSTNHTPWPRELERNAHARDLENLQSLGNHLPQPQNVGSVVGMLWIDRSMLITMLEDMILARINRALPVVRTDEEMSKYLQIIQRTGE